jgi:hypothetical protein
MGLHGNRAEAFHICGMDIMVPVFGRGAEHEANNKAVSDSESETAADAPLAPAPRPVDEAQLKKLACLRENIEDCVRSGRPDDALELIEGYVFDENALPRLRSKIEDLLLEVKQEMEKQPELRPANIIRFPVPPPPAPAPAP